MTRPEPELPPNVTSLDAHRQRRDQAIEQEHLERTPSSDRDFALHYLQWLTHPSVNAQKGGLVGKIMADLNEPEVRPTDVVPDTHVARRHLIDIMEEPAYNSSEVPDTPVIPISRSDAQSLAFQVVERLNRVATQVTDVPPNKEPIPAEHLTKIIKTILLSDFDGSIPPSA